MVKSPGSVHLAPAASEVHSNNVVPKKSHAMCQILNIIPTGRTFEAVEQNQNRSFSACVNDIEIEKISVGRINLTPFKLCKSRLEKE